MQENKEDLRAKRRYFLKLCEILMRSGTPSHRLEGFICNIAEPLKVHSQFYYLPQCMFMSFDAQDGCTTEVKLIRVPECPLNLGKIWDASDITERLLQKKVSVQQAIEELEDTKRKPNNFCILSVILAYGLASLSLGPFAFSGQWADLPIAFLLGCLLGTLRRVWSPSSVINENVFELVAVSLISFLSRLIGSVSDHSLFCFSSLAQSSIAMILPGYAVVIGILELQSRFIIAGATRVVFSMLYSFTVGFAITSGVAMYGLIDHNASSDAACWKPVPDEYAMVFVPLFTLAVMIINQANKRQMFGMMIISCTGYTVYFLTSRRLNDNVLIASGTTALVIGFLSNGFGNPKIRYWSQKCRRAVEKTVWKTRQAKTESQTEDEGAHNDSFFHQKLHHVQRKIKDRILTKASEEHGDPVEDSDDSSYSPRREHRETGLKRTLAAAVLMIPAILVQVPSGISAVGSLVSGIQAANEMTGNIDDIDDPSANEIVEGMLYQNLSLTLGYSMMQIAIAMTAGLYIGDAVWRFLDWSLLRGKRLQHQNRSQESVQGIMFRL